MIKYEDTIPFTLPFREGYVVKVYDGDTITLAVQLPGKDIWYRISIRLDGIDCAERRPKKKKKNGEKRSQEDMIKEKEFAIYTRDKLYKRIFGKHVYLRDTWTEPKYGRLMAQVYHEGVNINEWLLTNRLAVEYHGGTKQEINWQDYFKG